jgi:hypothetical protein
MANDYPVILCHGLFGWGPREIGGSVSRTGAPLGACRPPLRRVSGNQHLHRKDQRYYPVRGKQAPSVDVAVKVAEALGVKLSELVRQVEGERRSGDEGTFASAIKVLLDAPVAERFGT